MFLRRSLITRKRFVLALFLIVVSVIELNYVNDHTLLFYIVFIITAPVMEIDQFWRSDSRARMVFAVIVICSCLLGLISNYTMLRENRGLTRYAMGFMHPNVFAGYMSILILECFCVAMNKKQSWRNYLMAIIGLFIIDTLANGRTFELALAVVLLLSIVIYNSQFKNKIVNFFLIILPFILIGLSLYIVIEYDASNTVWASVNELVSNRISFAKNFMTEFTIGLWGQDIKLVGSLHAAQSSIQTHILDMGYLRFLLEYGALFTIMLCVFMSICMKFAIKTRNYTAALLLLFLEVSALFESSFSNPMFNFIIPIMAAKIFCDKLWVMDEMVDEENRGVVDL